MDAHSRHIFTALHALLAVALACAPRDELLHRSLKGALVHVGRLLRDARSQQVPS